MTSLDDIESDLHRVLTEALSLHTTLAQCDEYVDFLKNVGPYVVAELELPVVEDRRVVKPREISKRRQNTACE